MQGPSSRSSRRSGTRSPAAPAAEAQPSGPGAARDGAGTPDDRPGHDPATPAVAARAVLDTVPLSMRAIRQRMRSSRASGLTVPQFRALVFVRRHPATDLSTIAEHLGTSVPAASELVNRLVRQGLVTRRPDERERRRICLTLSDDGTAQLELAERETVDWLEQTLSALEPGRLESLVAALGDLRRLVGEAADGDERDPAPAAGGRRASTGRR